MVLADFRAMQCFCLRGSGRPTKINPFGGLKSNVLIIMNRERERKQMTTEELLPSLCSSTHPWKSGLVDRSDFMGNFARDHFYIKSFILFQASDTQGDMTEIDFLSIWPRRLCCNEALLGACHFNYGIISYETGGFANNGNLLGWFPVSFQETQIPFPLITKRSLLLFSSWPRFGPEARF